MSSDGPSISVSGVGAGSLLFYMLFWLHGLFDMLLFRFNGNFYYLGGRLVHHGSALIIAVYLRSLRSFRRFRSLSPTLL